MRGSGILLHISSLPSPYGIGTIGKSAYQFIDFLVKAGQKYWQVLPLGPTSYGDSPYQTFSAFAGNPYFIDLDTLIAEGLLERQDLQSLPLIDNPRRVDFEKIYKTRFYILEKAYDRFVRKGDLTACNRFIDENKFWLEDYALFMAIKSMNVEGNWFGWSELYRTRNKETMECFKKNHKGKIEFWYFIQYKFFEQWLKLKQYANDHGIQIIGDMPIYVAYDSSDVWANPKYWQLDENLIPKVVAGVPPDYFARTGQLWGNPIYDYRLMEKEGYSWWIQRIEESFKIYDVVRIDHFRGFESYYAIKYTDKTAEFGKWVKGPGYSLFKKIKEKLGDLPIIAEDLGFLTPEVYQLLHETRYPGMKILQFGFDPNSDSEYLPHNYSKNSIAYTGTHDNKTLKDWLASISDEEKEFCFDYANINHETEAVNKLIKCALASPSETVIIPFTDYLELGEEARFNIPSTLGNNWVWRMVKADLTESLQKRILKNTKIYKR